MNNKKQQEEILRKLLLLMSYDNGKTLKENKSFVDRIISEASAFANVVTNNANWQTLTQDTTLKAPSNELNRQTVTLPAGTRYCTWDSAARQRPGYGFMYLKDNPKWPQILKNNPFSSWFPDGSVRAFITPDQKDWVFWIVGGEDPNNPLKYRPRYWWFGEGEDAVMYDSKLYIDKMWVPRAGDETNIVSIPGQPNRKLVLNPISSGENIKENKFYFDKADEINKISYQLVNFTGEKVTIWEAKLLIGFGFKVLNTYVAGQKIQQNRKSNIEVRPNQTIRIDFDVVFGEDPEIVRKEAEKAKEEAAKQKAKIESGEAKAPEPEKIYPVDFKTLENGSVEVDYSFAVKQYDKEKEKRLTTDGSFVVVVSTSAGSAAENVPYLLSPTLQDERMVQMYKERAKKGLSIYGGLEVPDGFSSLTYDEFLELNTNMRLIADVYTYKDVDGKTYWKDGTPQAQKDKYFEFQKRRDEIKNADGMTVENRKQYNKLNDDIDKLINEFREKHKKYHPERTQVIERGTIRIPAGTFFDYEMLTQSEKDEYNLLLENKKKLAEYYGVDTRSSLDKFIDDYGGWIQLGIGLVAIIASFGGATPFVTFMYGLDVALGVGLGAYYLTRGDTANAVMSLFFAFLPAVHKLYKPLTNFFKVAPDASTALRLSELIGRQTFRTVDDLTIFRNFLKQTDGEMLKLFDDAMRVPKSVVGTVLEMGMETLKQANKVAPLTLKAGKWAGTLAKGIFKMIPTFAADIILLHGIQKAADEVSKKIKEMCPKCPIMTAEELRLAQTHLDTLNEAEAIALFSLISYTQQMISEGQISPEDGANMTKSLVQGKVGKQQVKKQASVILAAQSTGATELLGTKTAEYWKEITEIYTNQKKNPPVIQTKINKQITTTEPSSSDAGKEENPFGTKEDLKTTDDTEFEVVGGKPRFMPEK